ncbi:MAG TPA: hypothetical protein VGD27_08560, partial [Longimicrobiales bacterium]
MTRKMLLLMPIMAACASPPRVVHAPANAPAQPAPTTAPRPVEEPPRRVRTEIRVVRELPRAHPSQVGMRASILNTVDSIINAAIADGAAPGAAVAIGRHGRLVKLQG